MAAVESVLIRHYRWRKKCLWKKSICSSFFKLSLIDWQQTVPRQLLENFSVSQVRFTCSNATIETLEKGMI